MIHRKRIVKPAALLAALLLLLLNAPVGQAYHEGGDAVHDYAMPEFERTWARTDRPVAEDQVDRTWMWGPSPYTPGMTEDYTDAPGGERTVQYFDKSRMEDNTYRADEPWDVTNGLLAKELITGEMQVGDAEFEPGTPADVNVAGDPGSGPSYADLTDHLDDAPFPDGQALTWRLDDEGNVTNDPALADRGITAVHVPESGIPHNIADVFWDFMNSSGLVWEPDAPSGSPTGRAFVTEPLFLNPFYGIGFPITEAFWVEVNVAGTPHLVLMQCFERRCLTYTEENEAGWQIESGNVGQHYYIWRYGAPQVPDELLYYTTLSGDQSVPPVESEASGYAVFCLSDDGTTLNFQIWVEGIVDATAAHIHIGEAGTTGDVIVPLFSGAFSGDGVLAEGEISIDDLPEGMTFLDLAELLAESGAYVNVHTAEHPDGEIRGQIAVADDIELSASLSGAAAVPAVDTAATGTATFLYDNDSDSLSYTLEVTGIETPITAAHIHMGDVGVAGPVVAPLATPTNDTPSDGTLTADDLTGELEGMSIQQLVCHMIMGDTYVNVHSEEYPDGEIRGQVGVTMGDGGGEVETYFVEFGALNGSGVTGSGSLTLDGDQLTVSIDASGLEANQEHAQHIHGGFDDDTISTCPTPALDENADGIIDLAEGLPAYGDVLLDLMPHPMSDGDGNITYEETFTLTGDQLAALSPLDERTIVLHGMTIDPDGDGPDPAAYDGSLPIACGLIASEDPAVTFTASLSGDEEVPPVETSATGSFVARLSADGTMLTYQLIVADIENATDAHIHMGAVGADGDVVVLLWFTEGMPFSGSGLLWSGAITEADIQLEGVTFSDLLEALAAGGTYVNVHTAANVDGEIRGQVGPWEAV